VTAFGHQGEKVARPMVLYYQLERRLAGLVGFVQE
jgi:hypothetical protein